MNEPADRRRSGPCQSLRFAVHFPHTSRLRADGQTRGGLLVFIIPSALLRFSLCATTESIHRIFVVYPPAPASGRTPPRATRSRVPRSQRLRRRRFAPPLRPPDVSSRAVSLSNSFSPSGWNGECIAASAARRHGDPATDPHSGTRDSLPSLWPLRGQRLRRHQCPARYPGPLPSVHSPLHLSDSALLFQRVACLPNRLASSRRG